MDVQRTMEFILEQQAATSATLVEIVTWQAKTERRLSAISKLLQTGMKMLVKTDETLKELAAAQKKTELNLNRLIDSRRRGSNGHKR